MCYESPLGARSLVDQNVTLNSPVTPDQTRDCFHMLYWKPLLSDATPTGKNNDAKTLTTTRINIRYVSLILFIIFFLLTNHVLSLF